MNSKEISKQLSAPFSKNELKFRIGTRSKDRKKAMALAYIDSRSVSSRLDQVVGPENWETNMVELTENGFLKGFKCELSIWFGDRKVTRTDIGVISVNGIDKTTGLPTPDGIKGAASDAIKRAAVQFGIGRYIYDIETSWLQLSQNGYSFAQQPMIPDWALPENERGQAQQQMQQPVQHQQVHQAPQQVHQAPQQVHQAPQQVHQALQQMQPEPLPQATWGH